MNNKNIRKNILQIKKQLGKTSRNQITHDRIINPKQGKSTKLDKFERIYKNHTIIVEVEG